MRMWLVWPEVLLVAVVSDFAGVCWICPAVVELYWNLSCARKIIFVVKSTQICSSFSLISSIGNVGKSGIFVFKFRPHCILPM